MRQVWRISVVFFVPLVLIFQAISLPVRSQGSQTVQSENITITDIFYFGYDGLDLEAIKTIMPLHVGDSFDGYLAFHAEQSKIKAAIKKKLGAESTDEALILFGGRYIVFVGLPGRSNQVFKFLPQQTRDLKTPQSIHLLYDQTMEANTRHLKTGNKIEQGKYFQLRAETKNEALKIPNQLMDVLATAVDPRERMLAAHALGLIAHNKEQIDALVQAGYDSDESVRNNATRALGVLLSEQPSIATLVPAEHFINMVNSPTWVDRNKSIFVLLGLTKSHNPAVLQKLQKDALASLIEMCAWPKGYSGSALTLLARVGGMSDAESSTLIEAGGNERIVNLAKAKAAW
jgi:hypothetical protein